MKGVHPERKGEIYTWGVFNLRYSRGAMTIIGADCTGGRLDFVNQIGYIGAFGSGVVFEVLDISWSGYFKWHQSIGSLECQSLALESLIDE